MFIAAKSPSPTCPAFDGMTTSISAHWQPQREQEAEDLIRWAAAEDIPLEIVGSASKRALGRPSTATQTLDLRGLAGIAAYEPEELILTAAAGTPLAEIESALMARRQMLAFEPPDLGPLLGAPAGLATLGGIVATNLSGPRRPRAGAARDHVLGCRAISGRGETFYSGGRVVKNVTGYDLPKLLSGSYGTLAALTEITVKVLPLPETARTILLHSLDDDRAMDAMAAALGSGSDVSSAAHIPADVANAIAIAVSGGSVTAIRLEGFARSIGDRIDALCNLLAPYGEMKIADAEVSAVLWRAIADVEPLLGGRDIVWRLSVPPHAGASVAAEIRRSLPPGSHARHYYDWGGGLVWMTLAGDDAHATEVRRALAATGGHATLIRAPAALRQKVSVFQPQPQALHELSKRVKLQFDPRRILNPGRMFEDI
jgi:glycolate oxidase FAD binding subunit